MQKIDDIWCVYAESPTSTASGLSYSLGALSPAFISGAPSGTYEYDLTSSQGTSGSSLVLTASNSEASLQVSTPTSDGLQAESLILGSYTLNIAANSLSLGYNTYILQLTSEDGSTQTTYTIRLYLGIWCFPCVLNVNMKDM